MLRHFQPPRPTPVATAPRCRAGGLLRKTHPAPHNVATALRCRAAAALLALALGLGHAAAYEIQVRNLNGLSRGNGTLGPAAGASSATAGPIKNPLFPSNPYPASVVPGSDPAAPKFFLASATFGAPVSSGVPRYSLGEIIAPPLTDSGENPVDPSYWRSKPLQPGETLLPARSGIGAQPLLPALSAGEYQRFYYSEHADKVFAVQAGQVTITWVSKRTVTINGTTAYDFKTETFGVTSSTKVPVRPMFWTEKSFNAPAVAVPSGIIQVAKPIYTSSFPATVATEYPSVGTVNPDYNAPSELRTLWFESIAGSPSLRAYNREGRIFVEYLGELVEGSTTKRRFIGADIVEVSQVAPIAYVSTHLGDRVLPPGGDTTLQASPAQTGSVGGFFASAPDSKGNILYYAERENLVPDRVSFYWLEPADAAIEKNPASPLLSIAWPKSLAKYTFVWPDSDPAAGNYVQVTSGANGLTGQTGLQFSSGTLPTVVFQDDPSQSQAAFDSSTQRLGIDLSNDSNGSNLALLKFVSGSSVWYVRLHTQTPGRTGYLEADALPAINQTATVGERIAPPPGHVSGVIESGTGYLPAAYINPVSSGPQAAAQGAIIPVNSVPGNDTLRVRWFRQVQAPSGFSPFFVPSKLATYTLRYPVNPAKIVIASNLGSGDLTASQAAGSIYYQNNPALPGYNPNEEHALVIAGRAYALRDDLNLTGQTAASYSSEPFVILSYTATDGRPATQLWKVLREDDTYKLTYNATAGTVLQPPMPLPILPPNPSNREVTAGNVDPAPSGAASSAFPLYNKFTFTDRTGRAWLYRGPHNSESNPQLSFQFFYTVLEGFHVPGAAVQPAVGSTLPFLRPLDQSGNPIGNAASATTTPQTIVYRPQWPDAVPSLALAETLTLPVRGLPAVRGQKSAQILYQQSIAKNGTSSPSVALHDPTRLKVFTLNSSTLAKLPDSVVTTASAGRTYFQNLPPHLQSRFYFDPNFPSAQRLGALVLKGEFVPSATGENYLNLNVLSPKDVAALKDLCGTGNSTQKTSWNSAVTALSTTLETWVEDADKKGTYKLKGDIESPSGHNALANVTDPSTAVDSYALSATGGATGYVTLVFGNGNPKTTDPGDPVVVQIVKVVPELYQGDLKVLTASNPLSELVSLRHSGDYAGRPQDFEFEWRHTPALGSAPATYSRSFQLATTSNWRLLQNPASAVLPATNFGSAATLPRSVTIKDGAHSATLPGVLLAPSGALDFSAGVPERVILSAALSSQYDGFVAYVNGVPAIAYNAPAGFTQVQAASGLLPNNAGLALQFSIPPAYFSATAGNTVQIALYSSADPLVASSVDFQIHRSTETDLVAGNNSWSTPNGEIDNIAVVGGIPSAALSNPLLMVTDNWFTMRYKRKASAGGVQTGWSRWMAPVLVEGWAKRVLAAINPFNQRMTDLMSNSVNTDVSLVTQAGKRWEGDVPLNMDAVQGAGLIEIYETVLNRVKLFTLDSGIDYAPANDALLLSAGYLNDLYMILGNEAYADGINPTIAITAGGSASLVNTSRFSFEGQAANLLSEELALLRGRDDFTSPGTAVRPVYNRLYWNYTRGINSGEAIYALNYNITEKAGSASADGIIDAADAARMFPQGHGDAYGHYLTALKNYIRLLSSPSFTWTPRAETVNVLGQPVSVDYKDERKFALAAASLARTSKQIASNTWRQLYSEDPAAGWSHLRDGKYNSATGTTRRQGLDEWVSRGTQGAYYNWALANAILPDRETDPNKSGIQIIDRTTVPELDEIAAAANSLQATADSASARLNPLGLSPGSIAFDISPDELAAGTSHYEQIQSRALASLLNAKGAFDQASLMSASLRDEETSLDELNQSIVEQERAFVSGLKEIFGTPYAGDIGPGRSYPSGYDGPDTNNWFVIDPDIGAKFADTSGTVSSTYYVLRDGSFKNFVSTNKTIQDLKTIFDNPTAHLEMESRSVKIQPDSLSQLSNEYFSYSPGSRAVTGEIQFALAEARRAYFDLQVIAGDTETKEKEVRKLLDLSRDLLAGLDQQTLKRSQHGDKLKQTLDTIALQEFGADQLNLAGDFINGMGEALSEAIPESVLAIFRSAKSGPLVASQIITYPMRAGASRMVLDAARMGADMEKETALLDRDLEAIGFDAERRQVLYDFMVMYDEYTGMMNDIARAAMDYGRAMERARNAIAKGNEILAEREAFRKRAAALVSGFRTRDFAFRTFRNEALEQYSTLFDIASRYSYLAAKAYDYETGLLGTTAGSKVFSDIVASRSLGDLTGDIPRATTGTTGDSGLAGTMARLQSDWSVAKGRLGINNPDTNGTLFSIRRELFRIPNNPGSAEDDTAWRQLLEQHTVPDLLADRDIAASCRGLATADGSPVPGIVIPFGSTITTGSNFFGLPLSGGDHAFSASNFATKIFSTGVVLRGYEGMDPIYEENPGTSPKPATPNMLAATPYLYVIPAGYDKMQAPPLGNTGVVRSWSVVDQALPLPFNLGATAFNTGSYFNASGTLTEKPWTIRMHQAFRPVDDPAYFYGGVPREFTNTRLVARSVWNTGWKIVIPANTLHKDPQTGLDRFCASITDIELFLRTYSHSGN